MNLNVSLWACSARAICFRLFCVWERAAASRTFPMAGKNNATPTQGTSRHAPTPRTIRTMAPTPRPVAAAAAVDPSRRGPRRRRSSSSSSAVVGRDARACSGAVTPVAAGADTAAGSAVIAAEVSASTGAVMMPWQVAQRTFLPARFSGICSLAPHDGQSNTSMVKSSNRRLGGLLRITVSER